MTQFVPRFGPRIVRAATHSSPGANCPTPVTRTRFLLVWTAPTGSSVPE